MNKFFNLPKYPKKFYSSRQSDGFGLTVSGEHPLTVATLKPYGAAQLAGVREGDRILKVNGMLVSCSNFQEVIKMISGN